MKNHLLFIVFIFFLNLSLHAQIEKKTLMAGGSMSLNSNGTKGSGFGSSTFQLDMRTGYFVMKNCALGLGFNWQRNRSYYNSYGLSPFARYYVKNFFVELNYTYSKTTFDNYDLVNALSVYGSSGGIALGYAAFLNKNIALEPSIYYQCSFNNSFQSFGMKLGLQIYFNR